MGCNLVPFHQLHSKDTCQNSHQTAADDQRQPTLLGSGSWMLCRNALTPWQTAAMNNSSLIVHTNRLAKQTLQVHITNHSKLLGLAGVMWIVDKFGMQPVTVWIATEILSNMLSWAEEKLSSKLAEPVTPGQPQYVRIRHTSHHLDFWWSKGLAYITCFYPIPWWRLIHARSTCVVRRMYYNNPSRGCRLKYELAIRDVAYLASRPVLRTWCHPGTCTLWDLLNPLYWSNANNAPAKLVIHL